MYMYIGQRAYIGHIYIESVGVLGKAGKVGTVGALRYLAVWLSGILDACVKHLRGFEYANRIASVHTEKIQRFCMAGGGPRAGAGRPKGVPNKVTRTIKQAVLESFEAVGAAEYLKQVAHDDPRTYLQVVAKIIPAELHAKHSGDVSLTVVSGIDSPPGSKHDD